jgi:hypothetical protein
MLVPLNAMNHCLARRVARAAGTFEHLLTGRAPASVTVVANSESLVVTLHESFSPLERNIMATGERGRERVESYHRRLFEHSCEAFRSHLRTSTGVTLESAISHVDPTTGSVLKPSQRPRAWKSSCSVTAYRCWECRSMPICMPTVCMSRERAALVPQAAESRSGGNR